MKNKEGVPKSEKYQNIDILDQETMEMLKEHAADNPELVKDIFDSFAPEADELVNKITKAIEMKDFDALKSNAHSLAGISGSIGAMRLRQIAADVEAEIKLGDKEKSLEIVNYIFDAYTEFTQLLNKL
jgi:HPt (histidine-containing phosphotransfer) domain-containing protein